MKPIVGISCLHYKWKSLSEAFKRCGSEFGLDAIEFSYPNAVCNTDLPLIKKLNKKYHLRLSLHVWDDIPILGEKVGYQKMLDSLNVCRKMGASSLTIHLGTHPDRKEGLKIAAKVFGRSAILYEKSHIGICLENHYPYDYKNMHDLGSSSSEFLSIFNKACSPALKFCLDYGHANMTDNNLEFIKKLHPYLGLIHIADNHGLVDEHLPYGEGTVDWKEVLTATVATGFAGPYIIEFGHYDEGGECVEKFRKFAADLRKLSLEIRDNG